MSDSLLPCPWCVQRGERRLLGGGIVAIGCTWCGSTGPRAYGYDEARALWNANARFVSEAKIVLGDIADAIGGAGKLGETHGDTIRRLVAEVARLRADRDRLAAWLSRIDGGDNPCDDAATLRRWVYEAVTLGREVGDG